MQQGASCKLAPVFISIPRLYGILDGSLRLISFVFFLLYKSGPVSRCQDAADSAESKTSTVIFENDLSFSSQ